MQKLTFKPTKTVLATAIALGLVGSAAVAGPAQAAPVPVPIVVNGSNFTSSAEVTAADLQRGLELIDAIPEAVLLAGDGAVQTWIASNRPDLLRGSKADILGCAGAIAWLIASTAIPAAKILKIKRLIDGLGGVAKAVRLFWGASFKWEKIQALGGAAAALGAELLGVTAVKQKCFS